MSATATYSNGQSRGLLDAVPSFPSLNTWKENQRLHQHQLDKITLAAKALNTSSEIEEDISGESRTWNLRSTTKKFSTITAAAALESEESKKMRCCLGERRRTRATTAARPRFSVSLSTEEIAEDIYAVTGSLPRRRPRKRARSIQKQLDGLFPGLWLTEVTAELYRVPDS